MICSNQNNSDTHSYKPRTYISTCCFNAPIIHRPHLKVKYRVTWWHHRDLLGTDRFPRSPHGAHLALTAVSSRCTQRLTYSRCSGRSSVPSRSACSDTLRSFCRSRSFRWCPRCRSCTLSNSTVSLVFVFCTALRVQTFPPVLVNGASFHHFYKLCLLTVTQSCSLEGKHQEIEGKSRNDTTPHTRALTPLPYLLSLSLSLSLSHTHTHTHTHTHSHPTQSPLPTHVPSYPSPPPP